jgi:hypothetical protein
MHLANVLWSLCKGEFEPGDVFVTEEGVVIQVEAGRIVVSMGGEQGSLTLSNPGSFKILHD